MKLEVIVEDILLKTMIGSAKDEYKPILDLQENALIKRFGTRTNEAVEALDTLNKSSLMFAGVYQSVKSKLTAEGIFTTAIPDDFKRAYAVYVASEAVVRFLSKDSQGPMQQSFTRQRPISDFNLELELRDYNTIADVLENLAKYVSGASRAADVKLDITNYFRFLTGYSLKKLQSPSMYAYKETVENLRIKGKYFEVSGLKKSLKKSSKHKPQKQEAGVAIFEKDPTIITLERRIEKKVVMGNDEALNAVEIAVHHLLAYDPVKKTNPYLFDGGFRQLILLVGDSGTGKTMIFKYGISEAQGIAEAYNLDFVAVALDFEDSYQDGPVQILRHQLSGIVQDNRPYLVFVDEMESKFSARKSVNTAHFEQKTIREFLDFTNGLGYPNRGNYVLLGASNLPDQIDKAIRSRFSKGTYLCEGPKTFEEKARILYNNLLGGINAGYVQISDWRGIGEVAKSLELSGRELAECARDLIEKSRTNHFPANFYQLNFDDKLRVIKSHHDKVRDEKLVRRLYAIAEKKQMVQTAAAQFQAG